MHQGAIILTVNHLCQAVVDLCRVHKLQVCHGVLSEEIVACPLFCHVVSVIQVHVLDVNGFICIEAKLLADSLQPRRLHGKAAH